MTHLFRITVNLHVGKVSACLQNLAKKLFVDQVSVNSQKVGVMICYLASLVNCDWALEQSLLIATATVAGCSERSHF